MMHFSPFNPVIFRRHECGSPLCGCPHVFSVSDHIMVECFRRKNEDMPRLALVDADNLSLVSELSWSNWELNGVVLSFYELRGLDSGSYRLTIGDDLVSDVIMVTDDQSVLDGTSLVQFCQCDNKDRMDLVTWINGIRYYIDFRIPGGFLDEDWVFGVDNEQVISPDGDRLDIKAIDYTEKKLTVGYPDGVPLWFGDMVNRVMSCDLVYIDGQRYTRAGSTVPEKQETGGGKFVFTQMLRQAQFMDPEFERLNQLALRRTPLHMRRNVRGLRKM